MGSRPNPPYLITPCYLAGPDGTVTGSLITRLLDDGWQTDSCGDALVFSRREEGGLLEALHTRHGNPSARDESPDTAWEFTARSGPGQAAAWTVRFAPETPPELIAALAAALTDPDQEPSPGNRPHYLRAPASHEEATRPLEAAGWMRDLAEHECAWYAPRQQAVAITPIPPDTCGNGGANWLLAALRQIDHTALWYATAHPHTPTHLIHALCARLADPTPVPRPTCPGPETGRLTVTRP